MPVDWLIPPVDEHPFTIAKSRRYPKLSWRKRLIELRKSQCIPAPTLRHRICGTKEADELNDVVGSIMT